MSLSVRAPRFVLGLLAVVLVAAGCGSGSGGGPVDRAARSAATTSLQAGAVTGRVVAAGDIACPPGGAVTATRCRQAATASLASRMRPQLVFTLGDTQYQRSSLAELRGSYAKSWGSLLSRTRPTIGNHEYKTSGAKGYYSYFASRQPGPPGYYTSSANGWRFFFLNSNCDKVDCAKQAAWLDRAMTKYPSRCTIVTMHHPRYSSGREHGNNPSVQPLWRVAARHGNDVVLSGHDHDYERFVPLGAAGNRTSKGMQSFVVGTGGNSLYHLGTRKPGSAYFQARTAGVLALDLRAGAYHWTYKSIGGSVLDKGDRHCV